MITIRHYRDSDSAETGRLIADTYREFNLGFVPPDQLGLFLGPFRNADSKEDEHQKSIARILQSPMFYIAESAGSIVGALRGRIERLASLFVHKDFHRRGIAQRLVERFEVDSMKQGVEVIRVSATTYAVPFYLKMGYVRSTGIRTSWSFQGHGLPVQPMRKKIGDRLRTLG